MLGHLTSSHIVVMFLAIGVLLVAARVLGEIARAFNQPAVFGEILAGIILGPTLLGAYFPDQMQFIFPATGPNALVMDAVSKISVTLFMLVAGLDLDLSALWRQGRAAIMVSVGGIVVPFAFAFITAWYAPDLLSFNEAIPKFYFSLFFATALSISALPVIIKTLRDINLYRSNLGMVVIASAIFDDLSGWIFFAVILGLLGKTLEHGLAVNLIMPLTVGYILFTLSIARWLIRKIVPWLQAHTSWPGGVLSFCLAAAVLGAAFTEWIGIHAIFGAFLMGVALGDSPDLRKRTKDIIDQFVVYFFAPLFFASIGLKINFVRAFNWQLVLVVLAIACLGKIIGCSIGAKLGRFSNRESLAIGFGMNARGAMEIILGLLALQFGIISEQLFVALVIMALVTSLSSGPIIQALLKKRKLSFVQYLSDKAFMHLSDAYQRPSPLPEMTHALYQASLVPVSVIEEALWTREQNALTPIVAGAAVALAEIDQLPLPVIGIALSREGLRLEGASDEALHVLFLILVPKNEHGMEMDIVSDIKRALDRPKLCQQLARAENFTEFLAQLKIGNA